MNDRIYHYTNSMGLLGILGSSSASSSIWMTNIGYMNDDREFREGEELIKSHLLKKAKSLAVDINLIENLFYQARSGIFVASFTKNPDQLSQWRGYCKKSGYCIGFDKEALELLGGKTGYKFKACNYHSHESIINKIIDQIDVIFEKTFKNKNRFIGGGLEIPMFLFQAMDSIAEELPFLKHASFSEEAEFRLVKTIDTAVPSAEIKFRAGEDYLIPYYEVRNDDMNIRDSIKSIMIGPGPHVARSKDALDSFLNTQLLLGDIEVSASGIPLVSW